MSRHVLTVGAVLVTAAYHGSWIKNDPQSDLAASLALVLFAGVLVLTVGLALGAVAWIRRRATLR